MTSDLNARQTVPMTKADKRQLHISAADREISPGLLARALIRAGLADLDGTEVSEHVATEAQEARDRWSRAGRTAIAARYAKTKTDDDEAGGGTPDGTDGRDPQDDDRHDRRPGGDGGNGGGAGAAQAGG